MPTNRVQPIDAGALPPCPENAITLIKAALSDTGNAEGIQKALDKIAEEARQDALKALSAWVVRESEALAVRLARQARAQE